MTSETDSKVLQQINFMHRMLESYSKVHSQRYWDEISEFFNNQKICRVLDIGCGPGLLLKDLDEKFAIDYLIGLDLSPIMLDKAKEILVDQINQNRVEFIEQHIQENYSLPNNLDAIFSSRVLRSFNDPVSILSSINSSLNENGKLVILDWDRADLSHYISYFSQGNRFTEDFAEQVRLHRNFSRYSINDWVVLLENTGFKIIKTFQVDTVHICVIAEKSF